MELLQRPLFGAPRRTGGQAQRAAVSAIDAKKNLLNLEEARRRLKQLESDIKIPARAGAGRAGRAAGERSDKA